VSRFLLDTSVLIDLGRGREPVTSRVLEMTDGNDEVGVCAVVVAEFYAGLPPSSRPRYEDFVGSLTYWDISHGAAVRAGEYRYDFARRGQQLSTTDALIAAVARDQRAILVTGNVKHYPMSDIEVLQLAPR